MPNKLNVQFTARQSELLEKMAEEMGTTKGGVVKTALVLLQLAIREQKEGNAIGVIKGEKVLKEIVNIH